MINIIGDINTNIKLFDKFIETLNIDEKDYINISSIHSKRLIVISGKKGLIQSCSLFFKENNIMNKQLNVSAAFHSKLMENGRFKFMQYLEKIIFEEAKFNLISTVTGGVIHRGIDKYHFNEAIKDILVRQFCEPIRLLSSYQLCFDQDITVLDVVKRKFINAKDVIQ